jgi:dipeptidyl aminopeptidase/acylaminoacyl peptidase
VKNAKARIISIDNDLNRMIVRIGTADNPGLIYMFERTTGQLTKLADINETIGNKRLARAKYVQYDARDGLEIEAVLTLPRGREAKNLPVIAMPHGGPWGHDKLSYDYWAQFLANRGYAVIQPNFRGSTGYGETFLRKGQGQMGFAMQDDITDGVNWLVNQGIADPKKICIVGASYGGYAAMWGVVKDPDFYRCAISIAGVSNLRREVNDFGGNVYSRTHKNSWNKMTPDFKAVSPIYSVDKIEVPLMLIHGRKDVTVDYKQSVIMEKAMRKAGKPVEFVLLPKADHYFTREPDRLLLLQQMESFLSKHNPAY